MWYLRKLKKNCWYIYINYEIHHLSVDNTFSRPQYHIINQRFSTETWDIIKICHLPYLTHDIV